MQSAGINWFLSWMLKLFQFFCISKLLEVDHRDLLIFFLWSINWSLMNFWILLFLIFSLIDYSVLMRRLNMIWLRNIVRTSQWVDWINMVFKLKSCFQNIWVDWRVWVVLMGILLTWQFFHSLFEKYKFLCNLILFEKPFPGKPVEQFCIWVSFSRFLSIHRL